MDDDLLLNFAAPDPNFKPKQSGAKLPWRERRIEKLKADGKGVNFSHIDKSRNKVSGQRQVAETVSAKASDKGRDAGIQKLKDQAQKMMDEVSRPRKASRTSDTAYRAAGDKAQDMKVQMKVQNIKVQNGKEKSNGEPIPRDSKKFPESSGDKGGANNSYVSSLFTHIPSASLTQSAPSSTSHKPSNAPLNDKSTFADMGLDPKLAKHLTASMKYVAPTKVQRHVAPEMLGSDNDIFVKAQTGSGKTLAFCLPIISRLVGEKLDRSSGLFAIILTPTRELAAQIHTVLEQLLRCHHHLVPGIVVGGEKKKSEKARIRKGVNVLVATPGRLADHLENTESLDISQVRWLVMDEADRLVDLGFQETISKITENLARRSAISTTAAKYASLPTKRINVLCSATMPDDVKQMGSTILDHPKMIAIDDNNTDIDAPTTAPDQLVQNVMVVPPKLRLVTLAANLKKVNKDKAHGGISRTMVFFSCSDSVDYHYQVFSRGGTVINERGEHDDENGETSDENENENDENENGENGENENDENENDENENVKKNLSNRENRKNSQKAKKEENEKRPNTTPAFREVRESNTQPCVSTAPVIDDNTIVFRMHGSLTQQLRTSTISQFANNEANKGKHLVLLCTDVASRGLDLPNIAEVIEYDPPFSLDDHLHRIGRSARVGNRGIAYLYLLPGHEEGYVEGKLRAVHPKHENLRVINYESLLEQSFAEEENERKRRKTEKPDPHAKPGKWDVHATTWHLDVERWLLEDSHALAKASDAFISHIRAYATHLSAEKMYFNVKLLHLGHLAKSFGLRETPKKLGRSNTSSEAEKRKEDPRKKMLRLARSMEKATTQEFNY